MPASNPSPDAVSALLLELARALRARQFYPASHPALQETLDRTTAVWRDGIRRFQELSLELKQGVFELAGGGRIQGAGIDELAQALRLRGIRWLRIHHDLESEELLALIDALAGNAEDRDGEGSLEQILLAAGVRHITTTEMDLAERLCQMPAPQAGAPEEIEIEPGGDPLGVEESPVAKNEEAMEPEPTPAAKDPLLELKKSLSELKGCQDPDAYAALSNQVVDLISQLSRKEHISEGYLAALLFCRHAAGSGGRPAKIRAEAAGRLRLLASDPGMRALILTHACSGEGIRSVEATQILIALGEQFVPDLLERCERGGSHEQGQVTAILIAMGEVALPKIVEDLHAASADRVLRSIRLLGRMQNPRGAEFLLERLHEPDQEIRHEVARSLARIGTSQAVRALVDAARRSTDLAELVASSLGDTRSAAALQALIGMLDTKAKYPDKVKQGAIRSLGRMRSAHALSALRSILDRGGLFFFRRGRDRILRITAAQAIARIGGEEASTLLRAHSKRGDQAVARACRESLERMERGLAS